MKKLLIAAALTGSTIALAACSGGSDTTDEAATDDAQPADDTADVAETASVLDANSATAEQMAGVEGVTPELADAIVAGRPYASATAFNAKLKETLDDAAAEKVRVGLFVPVNLNTASKEDIKLIPGMTEKMEHEFEEYRPYEDMAEFDREIGKYVDEKEVARFRNYVTL